MRPQGGIPPGTILLDKYRIEDVLGHGGSGLVYRAHHLALDEVVAIKVLRSDVRLDAEALMRFQREAQAAMKLKSEHVARITDLGAFEDGSPYMVMEFLAGSDLGQMLEDNGPSTASNAVDLMLQACDALAEAHAIGIVHRDIKPTNLFLTTRPDGTSIVKILDFGISKSAAGVDLSLTQTASVLGTPAYMSPEQMRSARTVDARSDIWSLGTVLYELVEGRRPFRAQNFSEMCVMAAVDPHDAMTIAPQLEPIIARCLAKTPEGRYESMADLARVLAPFASDPSRAAYYVARTERVLGRGPDIMRPGGTPTPIPRRDITPYPPHHRDSTPSMRIPAMGALPTLTDPPRRSRRLAYIAIFAVAAAGLAAWVITQQTRKDPQRDSDAVTMPVVTLDAGPAETAPDAAIAVTIPDEPTGSAGSGSAGSGSAVATGSGSGKKATGNTKRGTRGAKRGTGGTTRGTARGSNDRGSASKQGAGSATAGSGSASTKKPCNVWEARTGC
ncbi:MAG: serine/threonine protein kinase [Deltaproteobacteria bacterium]|nr:serine/threonine protein kinase [Deltaproteobacteria bacterium]MDQ3296501.1 serine/threonine protein kinase [Myxococcota bacterium]